MSKEHECKCKKVDPNTKMLVIAMFASAMLSRRAGENECIEVGKRMFSLLCDACDEEGK